MKLHSFFVVAGASFCAAAAFAQKPITADSPFQIKYAGNLSIADSVINVSNSGASEANICVNVYVFSPDEQMISCCSCAVTPNGLVSLSARNDLVGNSLTPAVPSSIVVKLLASSGSCNPASAAGSVPGLLAWGTTTHAGPVAGTYWLTETPFTPARLGEAERTRLMNLCGFIQANGSGYGLCNRCRSGALGAVKQ